MELRRPFLHPQFPMYDDGTFYMLRSGPSNPVIKLFELSYLSYIDKLYIFCRNETSRAILGSPIQGSQLWQYQNPFFEPAGFWACTSLSMNMAMLKTKEDLEFAMKWLNKEQIPSIGIRGTIVRNEHWKWVDLDPRDFEIEFEFDKNLVLNSTTFERSVLTMNLDGYVRNVEPIENVPIIGCQFNLSAQPVLIQFFIFLFSSKVSLRTTIVYRNSIQVFMCSMFCSIIIVLLTLCRVLYKRKE